MSGSGFRPFLLQDRSGRRIIIHGDSVEVCEQDRRGYWDCSMISGYWLEQSLLALIRDAGYKLTSRELVAELARIEAEEARRQAEELKKVYEGLRKLRDKIESSIESGVVSLELHFEAYKLEHEEGAVRGIVELFDKCNYRNEKLQCNREVLERIIMRLNEALDEAWKKVDLLEALAMHMNAARKILETLG